MCVILDMGIVWKQCARQEFENETAKFQMHFGARTKTLKPYICYIFLDFQNLKATMMEILYTNIRVCHTQYNGLFILTIYLSVIF